jgi:hypothetical protein
MRGSGTCPESQSVVHVARDGNTIVYLSSQDLKAPGAQSLPLADASILSFKKN